MKDLSSHYFSDSHPDRTGHRKTTHDGSNDANLCKEVGVTMIWRNILRLANRDAIKGSFVGAVS